MRLVRIVPFLAIGLVVLASARAFEPHPTNVPDDPFSWVLASHTGQSDMKDVDDAKDATLTLTEFNAELVFPFYSRDALTLMAGGAFRWTRFDFDKLPGVSEKDLYTVEVPIDGIWGDDTMPWFVWARATPGIHSDFDGVNDKDFRVFFHGLGMYAIAPHFWLAGGVGYDREFGDDVVYPMGGVYWLLGDEWGFYLVFPQPRITYAPNPKLAFYVDMRPAGDMWNLREENDEEIDLKYESWRLGAGVEYAVSEHIWLHFGAGADVARDYKVKAGDRTLIDSGVEDSWFARAGIVIR